MIKGFIKLQEELHNRLLNLRSIEAMLHRPLFRRLWADSSAEQKSRLQQHINAASRANVAQWIRNHPSLELAEKSLAELKRIAYRLSIKNYSRKGKVELIRDIQNCEEKYGTQQVISA